MLEKGGYMRWGLLGFFCLLAAYLLYLAYFNAWASATPVPNAEVFKTRFYCLVPGAFITFGIGVLTFVLIGKKIKRDS
jgi:hypothetical protein